MCVPLFGRRTTVTIAGQNVPAPRLHASAIGTTVLQIKEIPERPPEFDGAICLFGLGEGVEEALIRKRFGRHGVIMSYEAGAGSTPAIVRFSTHETALAAKRMASGLTDLCAGIDTFYNER
eukprot:6520307-Prymnesium_polylepis.1